MKDYYYVTESTDMSGAPKLYITEEALTDKSSLYISNEKYEKLSDKYLALTMKYAAVLNSQMNDTMTKIEKGLA